MTAKTKKPNFGRFPAKILSWLRPFVEWERDIRDSRFTHGNLFLEPAAAGGIHIAAVTGSTMAVIHVPDGFVRRPCVIDVPDDAFDIAAGRDPIAMTFEGETRHYALPEWTQPGDCYVSEAGIFISPKMRPPQDAEQPATFFPALFQRIASIREHTVSIDYSMREHSPPDWRSLLQKASVELPYTDPRPMAISPALVALFEDVHTRISAADNTLGRFWFRLNGTAENPAPAIVMIENHPEFLGVISPMTLADPHPIPPHFFFPATPESEVKQ